MTVPLRRIRLKSHLISRAVEIAVKSDLPAGGEVFVNPKMVFKPVISSSKDDVIDEGLDQSLSLLCCD